MHFDNKINNKSHLSCVKYRFQVLLIHLLFACHSETTTDMKTYYLIDFTVNKYQISSYLFDSDRAGYFTEIRLLSSDYVVIQITSKVIIMLVPSWTSNSNSAYTTEISITIIEGTKVKKWVYLDFRVGKTLPLQICILLKLYT